MDVRAVQDVAKRYEDIYIGKRRPLIHVVFIYDKNYRIEQVDNGTNEKDNSRYGDYSRPFPGP